MDGEQYVQFGTTQLFPESVYSISADGANISLAESGVYLIKFKVDYSLNCYGGSAAVLELNGAELPASKATMAEKEGNSTGLYLLQAQEGSVLKIKLNDIEKLSSANFYVIITLFGINSESA